METISLKLQESVAREMDRLSKRFHYNTKTEFIREAIRDKIKELEMEQFIKEFGALRGKAKKRVSDEEIHKARETAFNKFTEKFT